ncbi:beta-ketoacyl synthase N-terminal-like domain-containing protein [Tunturiibacter psychrotolerans]|uniref:beta-ketoacyl synthase N-terminal-like domain-containing protein n=1 Tax=Tunturiibacter psychrotolerans TaxID=3069686 RepID=UPI003D1A5162
MDSYPQTPDQLSTVKRALVELRQLRAKLKEAERVRDEPIAIIGMGCRFPGGANNPESLWRMLCNATDCIREVPRDRWDINEFFDSNPDAPGKMSTRWAGFLDDVAQFDADFFGISPREAASLDPQQRLFLEVCWEALEHGGQSPEKLQGSSTGVFLGIASNDYAQLQMQFGDPAQIDAYFATGTCHSVAAGRVAYTLGLQGPALAIDTACSSSLVAVHLACQSLRLGECRMALTGGVNVILAPELLINFSKSHMMAADGRCKTFDASADGFVRAEGCGVVVLKRLVDAAADGDNILAVIRGTAVNQDGRSSGLTVPNGSAQQEVIRDALRNASVVPSEVGYVETHGTGTSLGDPIEVHALNAVYGEGRSTEYPLALGSIKTNFGHLETAAGIAGLLKTVLILLHGEIPPNLHFKNPNPHIAWNDMAVSIPTVRMPWPANSGRRIAAVSSFGFSGTNSHLVVESVEGVPTLLQADDADDPRAKDNALPLKKRTHDVLTLSAKTSGALQESIVRYAAHLGEHPELSFADVCHTANSGRSHFEHRFSVVAASSEQLRERLAACAEGQDPVGVFQAHADLTRRPEVVFLFTGQGGQYLNMGRSFYESEPVFREVVDRCDELLKPHLARSLRSVLYPPPSETTPLDETEYTHVAMFAIQYGLAQLWRSWGVEPGMVMGHSVGEIVAATVAGMISMEDGLMIMRERGRLMSSLPRIGLMASLMTGEPEVAKALEPYRDRVSIAALNGPQSTVISGERTAVHEVLHHLEAQGVKTKPLKVSNSFHSPLVEPVLEEFERAAARATYREPEIPQFSSMRLKWVTGDELLDAAYWRHNLRNTVRFHDAIAAVYEQGYRVFLEIGPSPILVTMGAQCLPQGDTLWLPSLRPDRDWEQIMETLGSLYVNGTNIDWNEVNRSHTARKVMLPTNPWIHKQFLLPAARTRQRGFREAEKSRWQDSLTATATQARQVPMDLRLESYDAKWSALDGLTRACIVHTLSTLGAFRTPDESYTLDSLLVDFRILSTYRPLIAQWLKTLAAEGILFEFGNAWCAPMGLASDLESSCHLAAAQLQDVPFLLKYMRRCGEMAPAILRGDASALDILFRGGSLELAESIYEHWALSRYFNGIVRSVVESLVRTLPQGSQLRIAEIGAGIGSATSAVLPVLPANRTLYSFTDVSKFFFDHAREKYKKYPFLRFGLLDIGKNPDEQGFGEHTFDVVVACNVLHATRNLDETINNVAKLLAPSGVLVLCEVTSPKSWIGFSYGLMEDWHRCNDELRQDGPLLPREKWEKLLGSHGFEDIASFPEAGSPAEILGQHCIVGRAPSAYARGYDGHAPWMTDDPPDAHLAAADENSNRNSKGRAAEFRHALRLSGPGEHRELLMEFVRSHVMKVLRRDRSDPIERRQRLMDLGFDSLMAVELRNALSWELELPQTLPATLIFDYPNVEAIAEYLASQVLTLDNVSLEKETADAQQRTFGQSSAIRQVPLNIEDLSDEEVERLLVEKLGTI